MLFANFIFSASEPVSDLVFSKNNLPASDSDRAITVLFEPEDSVFGYFFAINVDFNCKNTKFRSTLINQNGVMETLFIIF